MWEENSKRKEADGVQKGCDMRGTIERIETLAEVGGLGLVREVEEVLAPGARGTGGLVMGRLGVDVLAAEFRALNGAGGCTSRTLPIIEW